VVTLGVRAGLNVTEPFTLLSIAIQRILNCLSSIDDRRAPLPCAILQLRRLRPITADYGRLQVITGDYGRLPAITGDYLRLPAITGDYRRFRAITGDSG
jgi:hypothetical protein